MNSATDREVQPAVCRSRSVVGVALDLVGHHERLFTRSAVIQPIAAKAQIRRPDTGSRARTHASPDRKFAAGPQSIKGGPGAFQRGPDKIVRANHLEAVKGLVSEFVIAINPKSQNIEPRAEIGRRTRYPDAH